MRADHETVSSVEPKGGPITEPPSRGGRSSEPWIAGSLTERDVVAFDVIDGDDREPIGEIDEYPWTAICYLRTTGKDGEEGHGTGWLVGPRTVVTAGHVVCPRLGDGFVESVEVTPGRAAHGAAHPPVTANAFKTTRGWWDRRDEGFDYGAVILDPSDRIGDDLGFFGFSSRTREELKRTPAWIAGYPRDRDRFLVQAAGSIHTVESRRLRYDIDTEDGESGAPVFVRTSDGPMVVGIHTDGFPERNEGLRINDLVAETLRRWKYL